MRIAETTQDFVSCVVLFLETRWLTPYRNGCTSDVVFDAYTHYHACCVHKIGCLLRRENLPHTTGIKLYINSLLLECIHVVYYSKGRAQGEVFGACEQRCHQDRAAGATRRWGHDHHHHAHTKNSQGSGSRGCEPA